MRNWIVLLTGLLPLWSAPAQVLPPDAVVDGKTSGEWIAEQWKWILPIPTNRNPAYDLDGSLAHVGQPGGSMFLLAKGYNFSTTVPHRFFEITEDKYLFVPLIGTYFYTLEEPQFTVQELHDMASQAVSLIDDLYADIDGVPVPNLFDHRAKSPAFSIDFTEPDNLVSVGLRREYVGLLDPVVADGYALMIAPLPPGVHTIRFGGRVGPPVNRGSYVTNTITVVQVPLTQRVEELIELVRGSGLAQNRQRPLLATLEAVRASFEALHWRAGINQLGAFQNKVRAQDPSLADQLTRTAQTIIHRATAQSEGKGDL